MDAKPFELQIQIGVSKATGAPILLGRDFARIRRKTGAELADPTSSPKSLS